MTTQCDQSQDPFIPGPATFLRVNVLHNRCGLVGIVTTARSGQREPPRLVLEVGWTSTLQAAMPGKLKFPHFKVPRRRDSSFPGIVACKVEAPPTSSTSLGGSRWPDLAVNTGCGYFNLPNGLPEGRPIELF